MLSERRCLLTARVVICLPAGAEKGNEHTRLEGETRWVCSFFALCVLLRGHLQPVEEPVQLRGEDLAAHNFVFVDQK